MKTVFAILSLATFAFLSSGVEGSAKECYLCTGTCADPMEKQTCAELGTADAYQCLRQTLDESGRETDVRMCMPDVPAIKQICDALNESKKDSCTLCDTDLCNTDKSNNPGGSSAEMHSVSAVLFLTLFFILYRAV